MSESEEQIVQHDRADTPKSVPWLNRSVETALMLVAEAVAGLAGYILIREGNGWAIIAAALIGAMIGFAEWRESRISSVSAARNPMPGVIAPVALIAIAVFIVCIPTLHGYFSGDEFAYIPLFQNLSVGQFLHLFHSDLSQGVLGWSPHELRPLYGLSFNLSYRLWGLHPLGYHLTSIALHSFNAAMVFLIVKKIAPGNSWRAVFAALLFAMQPIHSWTISWANGSLTETVPSLFYILSFLGFVCYRAFSRTRYFVFSVVAFAACVFSKETSVTLPIMLVSYDMFLFVGGKLEPAEREQRAGGHHWLRTIAAYAPYALLLIVYLELRRVAFTSYLLEDKWGTHLTDAAATPAGFWLHFRHLIRDLLSIETFNVQHLLLWLPTPEVAIELGIYLAWLVELFRRRSECHRSISIILYFGFVWYGITNLPLLASYNDAHHLYLPSIGPCIAAAFLAVPICEGVRNRPQHLRMVGAALLVLFSAIQLYKEDVSWARKAEVTQKGTMQVAAALAKLTKPALVVISFPQPSSPTESWDEDLPYSLQPPFQTSDLYSRAFVIEHPDIYCCPLDHWWPKTRSILMGSLRGGSDKQIEIQFFLWDSRTTSFDVQSKTISRDSLGNDLTEILGAPPDEVETIDHDGAVKFVAGLGKLAARDP